MATLAIPVLPLMRASLDSCTHPSKRHRSDSQVDEEQDEVDEPLRKKRKLCEPPLWIRVLVNAVATDWKVEIRRKNVECTRIRSHHRVPTTADARFIELLERETGHGAQESREKSLSSHGLCYNGGQQSKQMNEHCVPDGLRDAANAGNGENEENYGDGEDGRDSSDNDDDSDDGDNNLQPKDEEATKEAPKDGTNSKKALGRKEDITLTDVKNRMEKVRDDLWRRMETAKKLSACTVCTRYFSEQGYRPTERLVVGYHNEHMGWRSRIYISNRKAHSSMSRRVAMPKNELDKLHELDITIRMLSRLIECNLVYSSSYDDEDTEEGGVRITGEDMEHF